MSSSTKFKKRFIAGASCPRCLAIDTTYTLEKEGSVSRNCVKCHFSEALEGDTVQVISLPGPRKD